MGVKRLFNLTDISRKFWNNRFLIYQLTLRDIQNRYKGSYLGVFWSFLTPVFMLTIYTFVFSVIFQARWGVNTENKAEFALILFCGLIIYNIFSEAINRSTSLILLNVNYVKKVVFPLEILPVTVIGSALFNAVVSFLVLITGILIMTGTVQWTIVLLPLVILPLLFITLGICWFLCSLGVYLRDIGNFISIISTGLLFLSPIFYPITAIPENLQFLYYFNPITYVVEDARKVVMWGQLPNWNILITDYFFWKV